MPLNNHAHRSTGHTVVSSTVKHVFDGEMVIDGLEQLKEVGCYDVTYRIWLIVTRTPPREKCVAVRLRHDQNETLKTIKR